MIIDRILLVNVDLEEFVVAVTSKVLESIISCHFQLKCSEHYIVYSSFFPQGLPNFLYNAR